MPKIDSDELEVLGAFEKGTLASLATKAELAKFKADGSGSRVAALKCRHEACGMRREADRSVMGDLPFISNA